MGWILLALAVPAALVSANAPFEAQKLKMAFYVRAAEIIVDAIPAADSLKINGNELLGACRYAADSAARIKAFTVTDGVYGVIGDRLVALADEGKNWIRERELLARAMLEARVLQQRMRRRTDAGDGDELRKIAGAIAALGGEEGCLRAVDLCLESAHYAPGQRGPALEGLRELHAYMEADQAADAVAAAQAAITLEEALDHLQKDPASTEAKDLVAAGLKSLAPHLKGEERNVSVVRRHNDFVRLARTHPDWNLKAEYEVVPVDVAEGELQLGVPVSREWHYASFPVKLYQPGTARLLGILHFVSVWQQTPAGALRRDIKITHFDWDKKYSVGTKAQKKKAGEVPGKNVGKLAAVHLRRAKAFLKGRKATGPKGRKAGKVRGAKYYEVTGLDEKERFVRRRGWFFKTKTRSFGIRVDTLEDFGKDPDAELQAFIDALKPMD